MHVERWTLEKAMWFTKQKRSFVKPNPGFMKILIDLEIKLFGISSIGKKR